MHTGTPLDDSPFPHPHTLTNFTATLCIEHSEAHVIVQFNEVLLKLCHEVQKFLSTYKERGGWT